MKIKEGDLLRSYLDGQLYKVREVGDKEVILENQDRSTQVSLGGWELERFFGQVDAFNCHLTTNS